MKYIFIILVFGLVACKDQAERNKELWSMLKSDNLSKIESAVKEIRNNRDTTMVGALLYNAEDPRMLLSWSHKGKTLYQIKMEALREITGMNPPHEITYKVDTVIIQYYQQQLHHRK